MGQAAGDVRGRAAGQRATLGAGSGLTGGDVSIRPLSAADLTACLALAGDRGWGREEHKWRLLFDVGSVLGMQDRGGELVATVVLTRYEPGVAVISMVLVASRLERRGLGTRLMTHVLEQAGPGPVYLYATPNGRRLYEKVGFASVDAMTTYVGRLPAAGAPLSRPARDDDLPAILALDAAVFGADRRDLLSRLPAFAEQLRDWVAERGVPPAFDTSLMVRGAGALPGDRRRLFLPVMQALG